MTSERLAITSLGVCSPAGSLDNLWDSLLAGRHHLTSLDDGSDGLPPRLVSRVTQPLDGLFPRRIEPGASRHARLAARALSDSLGAADEATPWGLVFSSAAQGQDLAEKVWHQLDALNTRDIDQEGLRSLTNSGAAQLLAARFGLSGFIQCVDGASCSGMLSLQTAALALRAGLASRIQVVAGEANLFPASLAFYEKKILLGGVTHTFFGRRRDPIARPLDQAIHPFGPPERSDRGAIGEAGVAVGLETFTSARNRGAEILAELVDVHTHFHADGYHGTDRQQVGLTTSLAPLLSQPIHSWHLPVSGAWALDFGAIAAASRAFPGCHAFSAEPVIGHSGAASSLLNLALAVLALRRGTLLPTRGVEPGQLDPACLLAPSPHAISTPATAIGILACGWGGWNAAAQVRLA